jgi:glycosyltransferase involved in cell wall biosynthesis
VNPGIRVGLSETLLHDPRHRERLDGIGIYTQAMHKHLALRGEVSVVPVVMGRTAEADLPADCLRFEGPSRLDAALAVIPWRQRRLRSVLDVYFATDYRVPCRSGIPVCATLFDAIPLSHPHWANPRLRFAKNIVLRKSAQCADRVLAISRAMVPQIVEFYDIPEARIAVTPLGVEEAWFKAEPATRLAGIRRTYGLTGKFFLFVGTLQPRKNVERILAAYARLPERVRDEYQMAIAGKAGWSASELVASLRAAATDGKVRWLARVPDSDLRALYQAASGFVFPSLYEGFGLPVLEAFASGIPVITSTVTSLPELAQGAALLVDPTDVDAIADAMERIAQDTELVAALVEKGRARATTYTWERCGALTRAALADIR